MDDRLRFGIFMAPFHDVRGNPPTALQRDLDLIAHLDRLGYDEAWIGEHHSCGTEIIGDPFIFASAALQATRDIRLGTGVCSVPYHNPLWTAERVLLMDNLFRGRFMFGAGPGALPTDAHMIGIEPSEQRRMLGEGMDAIMHLLTSDEPLTMKTDWFELNDAKCQIAPWSRPAPDCAVAAIASPSGPRLAGKHGIGLLSIGATMQAGADVLGMHWDVAEQLAAENGRTADRSNWRLVGVMHCAETREQAIEEVKYGIEPWFDYLQLAVFRTIDDRFFAIEDHCPHRRGPLSQGIVHGTAVTCPLHNWVISLETGDALGVDAGRVRTFAVRRKGDLLLIDAGDLQRLSVVAG